MTFLGSMADVGLIPLGTGGLPWYCNAPALAPSGLKQPFGASLASMYIGFFLLSFEISSQPFARRPLSPSSVCSTLNFIPDEQWIADLELPAVCNLIPSFPWPFQFPPTTFRK